MRCPFCGSWQTTVYDTRYTEDGKRRRRRCRDCWRTFRTKERVIVEKAVENSKKPRSDKEMNRR